MVLLLLFLLAFALWLLLSWYTMRPKNFPPGPPYLPLLGSALSVPQANPHFLFEVWREKYGPVVGLLLGPKVKGVAICGAETVLEVLRSEDFQGRPDGEDFRERTFNKRLGVIFNDGPRWVHQRRFIMRNLRDFGVGKLSMEGKILEEVEDLLELVRNKTMEVTDLFALHMVNIIWAVLAGSRFERHDAQLKKLLEGVNHTFRSGNPTGSTLFRLFPILKTVAPNVTGYADEVKYRTELQDFLRDAVHDHMKTLDEENPRDFIDVYIREMKNSDDPTFTEDGLVAIMFDLFAAGAESVSNTLSFSILYLALYPEVQKKAQKELDSVVGQSRRVSLEDRPRLPYFEAVITEISRINSIAPMCPPHTAIRDTTLKGYNIPKGTMLFISLYSVLQDQAHWGDPETFRPERFIEKNTGNFVRDPYFINFGIGERTCLGLPLARNNLFLFLGVILQEFNIALPQGDPKPSTIPLPGFTTAPKPFRVEFQTRQ